MLFLSTLYVFDILHIVTHFSPASLMSLRKKEKEKGNIIKLKTMGLLNWYKTSNSNLHSPETWLGGLILPVLEAKVLSGKPWLIYLVESYVTQTLRKNGLWLLAQNKTVSNMVYLEFWLVLLFVFNIKICNEYLRFFWREMTSLWAFWSIDTDKPIQLRAQGRWQPCGLWRTPSRKLPLDQVYMDNRVWGGGKVE
jgi:hypothetical protein